MAGALVHDFDLAAFAGRAEEPASPGHGLHGEESGASVHQQLPERRPADRLEGHVVAPAIDDHLIAVHFHRDLATAHVDNVLHARSSTATVSTCAVWGKRSNARTSTRR